VKDEYGFKRVKSFFLPSIPQPLRPHNQSSKLSLTLFWPPESGIAFILKNLAFIKSPKAFYKN
jgi:hypothetical protein